MKNETVIVFVSATAANKICKSFKHNPLMRDQGNPNFLSLMGIHKECIANMIEYEPNFGGGQHGCTCIAMGEQKYILQSNIVFVPPKKRDALWCTRSSPSMGTSP